MENTTTALVDHATVVHDLVVGMVVLATYIATFLVRRKKKEKPPTGAVVDVFIDAVVVSGAAGVLWRLVHHQYVLRLSPEEHIIAAAGCIAIAYVLASRLFRNLSIAWTRPRSEAGPKTDDAWHEDGPE